MTQDNIVKHGTVLWVRKTNIRTLQNNSRWGQANIAGTTMTLLLYITQ